MNHIVHVTLVTVGPLSFKALPATIRNGTIIRYPNRQPVFEKWGKDDFYESPRTRPGCFIPENFHIRLIQLDQSAQAGQCPFGS